MDQEKKDDILVTVATQQGLKEATEFEKQLGITREYSKPNRDRLWDSTAKKRAYKEKILNGKKTYKDPITGQTLHGSQTAAQKKYHMKSVNGVKVSKKWASHSVEIDHRISIKELHERVKYNSLLSNNDLQEIANKEFNYRATSKQFNASKGEKSDFEIAFDPNADLTLKERSTLLGEKVVAEIGVNSAIAARTLKNAGKVFAEGAKDALAASAIPLAIRGTQDLMKVANGDMTMKEAVEDIGNLGLSIAASGGSMRTASIVLGPILRDSKNSILEKFADVNQFGNVLVIGSIVVRAAGKYMDGEVDAEGFFTEVGQEGLSLAAGMLASKAVTAALGGAAIGGPAMIVPMLAAMAASAACQEIYAQAKRVSLEKKDNEEIRHIAAAASSAIQEQQQELRRLMEENHARWAEEMNEIFQMIAVGLVNNDLPQTNLGLRNLAKSFSTQVSLYETGEDLIDDLMAARNGTQDLHLLRGEL